MTSHCEASGTFDHQTINTSGDHRNVSLKKTISSMDDVHSKKAGLLTLSQKKRRQQNLWAKRLRSVQSEEEMKQVEAIKKEISTNGINIQVLIQSLTQGTKKQQTTVLKKIRKLLCLESESIHNIIDQLIHSEVFLNYLSSCIHKNNEESQLEAVWCVTNMAAHGNYDHVKCLLRFAPDFILFLSGTNSAVQEQCLWALGNIAGESAHFRDILIKNGVLVPLINILAYTHIIDIKSTGVWCLMNLLRGSTTNISTNHMMIQNTDENEDIINSNMSNPSKSQQQQQQQQQQLFEYLFSTLNLASVIVKLLESKHLQTKVETSWLLTYLTGYEEKYILALVEKGVLSPLISCMVQGHDQQMSSSSIIQSSYSSDYSIELSVPSLRVMGNILRIENNSLIDAILKQYGNQIFILLHKILISSTNDTSPNIKSLSCLKKEAIWIISNITGGTPQHVDAIVNIGFIPLLKQHYFTSSFEVKKEILFCITNICSDGRYLHLFFDVPCLQKTADTSMDQKSTSTIKFLIEIIKPVHHSAEIKIFILKFLDFLYQAVPVPSQITESIEEVEGGLDVLEKLAYSKNIQLSQIAQKLLDDPKTGLSFKSHMIEEDLE